MNVLTFDIEEWYLERISGNNRSGKYYEYDECLDTVLNILDSRNIKATFFCVGGMGREFPYVLKKIAAYGHEIGCHSDKHSWANLMTESEFRIDTDRAIDSLEQCIGKKILSYRAPAFSITEKNKWAFEILAENGIKRDSSIFPAKRDFGGYPNFCQKAPCIVNYKGIQLREFPICTTEILGKEIAYSGGGYFRLFPLKLIKYEMSKTDYNMNYFHISDLIPEKTEALSRESYEAYYKQPGTLWNRYVRFFKSNYGKKESMDKLMKMIGDIEFINLEKAEEIIDWNNAPIVKCNYD